jgi:hypothetical protein
MNFEKSFHFEQYPGTRDLFEKMLRLSNGEQGGAIKTAALNLLIAVICTRASNVDEAIIQWNELSANAEILMRGRFKSVLSSSDQFDPIKVRLNGG